LEQDTTFLDPHPGSNRDRERILYRVRTENSVYLSRVEKSLADQGFTVKRSDKEDLKKLLAVYFEQNVTTDRFEDFDGERWMIFNDW
jgi:hypothetical protein